MEDELEFFIITEIITIDHSKFDDNTKLLEYGLDSIKTMRLIAYIESHFDIIIPDNEVHLENINTLSEIKRLIQRCKKIT